MVPMAAERSWTWVFLALAGLAIVGSVLANQIIFATTPSGEANRQALAVLFDHDHAHFGVAMVVGFVIVAGASFGMFRLVIAGKRDSAEQVTSGR